MRQNINSEEREQEGGSSQNLRPSTGAGRPILSRREALVTGALCVSPLLFRSEAASSDSFALPGPFRGRVVEVSHAQVIQGPDIVAGALREMMRQGMMRLTGEKNETAAWRRFFGPNDVVGIKGSPVGKPDAIAHPETLAEVVRGLRLAGVRPQNIVVFERNDTDLRSSGYRNILPLGGRIASGSPASSEVQLRTEGYPGTTVTGYDEKVFVEFPRLGPGADAQNPAHRRSHLLRVVSRDVTKIVNVCALKDHAAAGLTMALKNLSHGCFNNVWRTHTDPASPWVDEYIPSAVSLPAIRQKVVLNLCDALWGVYDGGPGNWNPHFRSWAYRTLLFATDPVALDRIGWNILDTQRRSIGLPPLAKCGTKAENPGHEAFARRQPEHVTKAGQNGLGESNLNRIAHLRIKI
jgi:hypothetical protein